ncbi:conserved oligomeric Golgi complex subunit 1 [Lingula anatina]|uniref:Conserved oligomeric Golgi complex subunit 1 n=1 Tax=Lingula anatina TaxID=7574 RepID=A0A1S3H6W0_LINAN|nr:conserved oligomeric Golgi complex subunit 1 [Lingula anatina]|eukprot:XP_013380864.1 conserved oligomeric Golgi complex subunit 1 [Lingula anatina]
MAERVKPAMPAHEMDTNVLFEKFTVDEIRQIERKIRSDIERKKEDLRQMVGERYRDLIEAADTISEMKKSAENVTRSIASMQDYCKNLNQTHMVRGAIPQHRPKGDTHKKRDRLSFYGVSSQIKLLLDTPERIWSSVEEGHFLQATQLYLLARHVHTSLQMDSQKTGKILSHFPVLGKQWAAISHFRTTVLQGCRNTLKDATVSEQTTAECLCSIMLLEDSTPRQVFNEFLLARTSAVEQLFHPSQQSASIKQQVCSVVQLIVTTIQQIHAVFYSDSTQTDQEPAHSNLLLKIVEEVTERGGVIPGLQSSISTQYLPKSVLDFRPSLKSHVSPIAAQTLQENCTQWVDSCVQAINSGVSKLLGYVNTVKGVAGIRDAVWEQLANATQISEWDNICGHILKRKVPVWDEFIRPLFLARLQGILQSQFDSTLNMCKQHMTRVMADVADTAQRSAAYECAVGSYIWNESQGDIVNNSAWVAASNKTLLESGGLLMKAKAYTPAVQSLCGTFDSKLKALLEDSSYYIKSSDTKQTGQQQQGNMEPFDRFIDEDNIRDFIREGCKDCVKKLLDHINEELEEAKNSLQELDNKVDQRTLINRVLLLGRLCGGLCELSTHMEQCVVMQKHKEKESVIRVPKRTKSQAKTEDPHWSTVKNSLVDTSHKAYSIWCQWLSSCLAQELSSTLQQTGTSILENSTSWDEVEIQEETEDGATVASKIRVPMLPSWSVQTLLYKLCEEINTVGGHAVRRSILLNLVHSTSKEIIDIYRKLLDGGKKGEPNITQNQALQLLFDVKFLVLVLPKQEGPEEKSLTSAIENVVDGIESHIDPFDLDVFNPYLKKHVGRHAQRCAVIYGALTSLDKHGSVTMRGGVAGQHEQHNVLPLASNQMRFQLLPLSTQPSRMPSDIKPVIPPPVAKVAAPSRKEKENPVPQPQLKESSSFYNRIGSMGTLWFSNIGGKNN